MPTRRTNPNDKKIVPFQTNAGEGAKPEDDPSEWVYPDDSGDDFALRLLAGEIVDQDPALASLLLESAKGDLPTGELVRRLNAWQAMMGGGQRRSPRAAGAKPWLV